jgi:hypothetical protein
MYFCQFNKYIFQEYKLYYGYTVWLLNNFKSWKLDLIEMLFSVCLHLWNHVYV